MSQNKFLKIKNDYSTLLENALIYKDLNALCRQNRPLIKKFKNEVRDLIPVLKTTEFLRQFIYHVENELNHLPLCKSCNTRTTKWHEATKQYQTYCSVKCAHSDSELRDKIRNTNIEKYGFNYDKIKHDPDLSPSEKYKLTSMIRYGVDHVNKSESGKTKIAKTNLAKYGVKSTLKDVNVLKKIAKTNLEKYGAENVFGSDIIKERIKETNMSKYGAASPLQNATIKEKLFTTNLKRYGHRASLSNSEVSKKIDQTNMRLFGTLHPSSVASVRAKISSRLSNKNLNESELNVLFDNLDDKDWLEAQASNCSIAELANRLGVTYGTINRHLIKHNIIINPETNKLYSAGHKGVVEYLKTLNLDLIVNTKKYIPPYELDIVIPSHNIAIEYNGIFWHGEVNAGKSSDYHLMKLNRCNDIGLDLLHIREDQWLNKPNAIKLILSNLFKKRRCVTGRLKELDHETYIMLANQCSVIDNYLEPEKVYGYYHKDHLVMMIAVVGDIIVDFAECSSDYRIKNPFDVFIGKSLNIPLEYFFYHDLVSNHEVVYTEPDYLVFDSSKCVLMEKTSKLFHNDRYWNCGHLSSKL